MQLSADRFDDLNSAMETHRVGEPRVFGPGPRILTRHIRIAPVLAGKSSTSLDAVVQDFTPQHLNLLLGQALNPGDKFVAEFPSRHERVVNLLCSVREVTPSPNGRWSHDCEFICAIVASRASDAAEIHRISSSMFDW